MFVHAIFAHFGRQNRLFGQNATEREKRRDWLAEKIGFELVVAFRWAFVRGLLPDKVRISPACSKQRVPNRRIGQTAGCRMVSAKPKVSSLS